MLFDWTKIAVLLWLCCCLHFTVQSANGTRQRSRNSSGSRSSSAQRNNSMRRQRSQRTAAAVAGATAGATAAVASEKSSSTVSTTTTSITGSQEDLSGNNTTIIKPQSTYLKNLMRSSVDMMQRSVDSLQGMSTAVFQTTRKTIGISRESLEKKSGGVSGRSKQGIVGGIGRSVANLLETGVTGMEQATDLGLVMARMGTSKMRSELDGTDGNKEILNILVKYIASRIGMGTRGNAVQFVDDIGTISTYMADDDDVTKAIATIMKKFMENPKVSVALIRIVLTIMESSPSTSCLLDQMPLSAADLRMLFDVFVGSNGQEMMKTVAGLLKDMTTGPDTKAFLTSLLSMMSMFKSDTPAKPGSTAEKTSLVSSLTNFLTAGDEEENNHEETEKPLPPRGVKRKRTSGSEEITVKEKPKKKRKLSKEDTNWFSSDEEFTGPPKSRALTPNPMQQVSGFDTSKNSFDKKTKSGTVAIAETKSKTASATNSANGMVVENKNKSQASLLKTQKLVPVQPAQDNSLDNDLLDVDIQPESPPPKKRKSQSVQPAPSGNVKIAETDSKTASVVVEKQNKPQSSLPKTKKQKTSAQPISVKPEDDLGFGASANSKEDPVQQQVDSFLNDNTSLDAEDGSVKTAQTKSETASAKSIPINRP